MLFLLLGDSCVKGGIPVNAVPLQADRDTGSHPFFGCLSPPCCVLTPWSCIYVCHLKGAPPLLNYPSNLLKGSSPKAVILGGRALTYDFEGIQFSL